MTIAVAYLTSDGLVLGADSTTAVSIPDPQGGAHVGQLLNHAQKVFEIGSAGEGMLGLATWGMASFPEMSIRTLVARISDDLPKSVTAAADLLVKKVTACFPDSDGRPPREVGFFVGGVNLPEREPACAQILFPADKDPIRTDLTVGEAVFQGQYEFFTRVFWGHAPQYPQHLYEGLAQRLGTLPEDFQKVFQEAHLEARNRVAMAGSRDMPIREAIDYVHLFLSVTVKSTKFRYGPPTCGGPIEIGFITTDRSFRWICHKDFDSALREHGGHDVA